MAHTVIFDFDGTLADTMMAMMDLYNRFAPRYGCRAIDPKDLPTLRGKRPSELMRTYRVRWFIAPFLARRMRNAFAEYVTEMRLHPGIVPALHALHDDGVTLGILSSNNAQNILPFLTANGIADLFAFVEGYPNLFRKDRALRSVMHAHGLTPDNVVYVGDETRDVEAAHRAGVRIVSVSWGFQTHAVLEGMHPEAVVATPDALLHVLRGMS